MKKLLFLVVVCWLFAGYFSFAATVNDIALYGGSVTLENMNASDLASQWQQCYDQPGDDDNVRKAYYMGDTVDAYFYSYITYKDWFWFLMKDSKIHAYGLSNFNPQPQFSFRSQYLPNDGTNVIAAKIFNAPKIINYNPSGRTHPVGAFVMDFVYRGFDKGCGPTRLGGEGCVHDTQWKYTTMNGQTKLFKIDRMGKVSEANGNKFNKSCVWMYVARCGDGVVDNVNVGSDDRDGKKGILINGMIYAWQGSTRPMEECECANGRCYDANGNTVTNCNAQTCRLEGPSVQPSCTLTVSTGGSPFLISSRDQAGNTCNGSEQACNDTNPQRISIERGTSLIFSCNGNSINNHFGGVYLPGFYSPFFPANGGPDWGGLGSSLFSYHNISLPFTHTWIASSTGSVQVMCSSNANESATCRAFIRVVDGSSQCNNNGIREGQEQCDDGVNGVDQTQNGCWNCELQPVFCTLDPTPSSVDQGGSVSWFGQAGNSRAGLVSGIFAGGIPSTWSATQPYPSSFTHVATYQTPGTYVGTAYVVNTYAGPILSEDIRPRAMCSNFIVVNQTQVSIQKLQRNVTRNTPLLGAFTGEEIGFGSGDIVSYRFVLYNNTSSPQNVEVRDQFPDWFIGGGWTTTCPGANQISFTNDRANAIRSNVTIPANGSCILTITGRVAYDSIRNGDCQARYINTGYIYQNNTVRSTGVVYAYNLTGRLVISKTFSGENIIAGTTGYVTISISSIGNTYNVFLTDYFPSIFQNVSSVSSVPSSASDMCFLGRNGTQYLVRCGLGNMVSGQVVTFTFAYYIPDNQAYYNQTVTNIATGSAYCIPSVTGSDSITIIQQPQGILQIIKEQMSPELCARDPRYCDFTGGTLFLQSGDQIVYRILYRNLDPVNPITTFSITDAFPAFLGNPVESHDNNGYIVSTNFSSNPRVWHGQNLDPRPRGSGWIMITGTLNMVQQNTFVNIASGYWGGQETGDTVVAYLSTLIMDKQGRNVTTNSAWYDTVGLTVNLGDIVEFRLIYFNATNAPLSNVQVIDTLPTGLTYVSTNPGFPTPVVNGQTLIWTIGTVPAMSSGYILFRVRVSDLYPDIYTYLNTGIVTNGLLTGIDTVLITRGQMALFDKMERNVTTAGMRITDANQWMAVRDGDIVEYRIEFANPTPLPLVITVSDTFPLGFVPTARSDFQGNQGNLFNLTQQGNYYRGPQQYTLAPNGQPGSTGYVHFTGMIQTLNGQYTVFINTGYYILINGSGSDIARARLMDFGVSKTLVSPQGQIQSQGIVRYRICGTNNGAAPITSYTLSDLLPATMTYVGNVQAFSGTTLLGSVLAIPTVVSYTGWVQYIRGCASISGTQLNGLSICPLQPGVSACIEFDARLRR